jgi:predicted nucleic acid-binding protein
MMATARVQPDSGYVLDTNVIAELTRDDPDPGVIKFLSIDPDRFWLSSLVLHEIEFGIRLLPEGRIRVRLQVFYDQLFDQYEDRILPFNRAAAISAARFRAIRRQMQRSSDVGDALIAGTAKAFDVGVATRNVRDFEFMEIPVINPWQYDQ